MNSMRRIIIAQAISVLLIFVGLLGIIREGMEWGEWIPERSCSAVLLLISACIFLFFLQKEKLALCRLANIFAAAGMGVIFLSIANDCLFSGDVPPSSILLFGTPSALRVLSGILAAWKGITPASKAMGVLVAVINGFIAALGISLFLNLTFDAETMACCFELGSGILYIDMAVFMYRSCPDTDA